MRILLTGADGFVGRHVTEQLACVPLAESGGNVDLRERDAVAAAVARISPDAVIHLAAQSFVPASFQDPRETFDVNFYGTYNLLGALKQTSFKGRMLYVGSGDVYGLVPDNELPIRESVPLRPRSPYAVSKVAAEALCYQWSQTAQFEIVMARPFNHIGPGQSPQFAISNFAKQIVEIERGVRTPVLRVGDIDVTRDFTDVRDVVLAYEALLHRGVNGTAYNICSGVERSLRDVIERLSALAGIDTTVLQESGRLRPAEQRRVCGSRELIHRDTGWKPRIPIEKALTDLLMYWEEIEQ